MAGGVLRRPNAAERGLCVSKAKVLSLRQEAALRLKKHGDDISGTIEVCSHLSDAGVGRTEAGDDAGKDAAGGRDAVWGVVGDQ